MGTHQSPPRRRLGLTRRGLVRLAILLGLYLMLIGCGRLADWLILFPRTDPLDPRGATRELLGFQGGELELWTASSPGALARGEPQAYVLHFVGNADRADRHVADIARSLGRRPVEVVGVNYPGYGGSTGPARLDRLGPAALAAYDAVRQRAGPRPIFVEGASLGSAVALHVAAQRDVAALTLHNPPPIRQVILRRHGWWNLWLLAFPISRQVPAELDAVANARRSTAPALFIGAEHDEIVPPRYQQMVIDAYGGPKRQIVLRGAFHNDAFDEQAQLDVGRDTLWLWEQAGLPPPPP